jgi:putative molybdopterin biosynthesis protein
MAQARRVESTKQAEGNPLLTVKEVCQELQLSRNTVYALIRSGELQSYRLRGQYRVSTTQLMNYLNDQKENAL